MSGTAESAVASFFTPASQKPKERTTWTERAPDEDSPTTLLVGRYAPENEEEPAQKRRKIAAFDLVGLYPDLEYGWGARIVGT
jgi:bifunctional polynucleotide phosphatase/kinase